MLELGVLTINNMEKNYKSLYFLTNPGQRSLNSSRVTAQVCSIIFTGLHVFSRLWTQITKRTFYHSLCSNQMLSGNLLFLTSVACGWKVNLAFYGKTIFSNRKQWCCFCVQRCWLQMAEEWLFPLKVIDMSTYTWEIEFHYLFFLWGLTEYRFQRNREQICVTEYHFLQWNEEKNASVWIYEGRNGEC